MAATTAKAAATSNGVRDRDRGGDGAAGSGSAARIASALAKRASGCAASARSKNGCQCASARGRRGTGCSTFASAIARSSSPANGNAPVRYSQASTPIA